MRLFADVGGAQDSKPFGIGGHDAILDSVVNHLDEMATAAGPAMQIPVFGGSTELFSPRGARYVADSWGNCFEDGIEVLHCLFRSADHHAITALEAPHTAACSYVNVVNSLLGKLLRAA